MQSAGQTGTLRQDFELRFGGQPIVERVVFFAGDAVTKNRNRAHERFIMPFNGIYQDTIKVEDKGANHLFAY